MSRYALIEVHDLREAGPLHLPRFRGTFEEIADALIPAFVSAAGEARRYEATRTIRDAVLARKGAG